MKAATELGENLGRKKVSEVGIESQTLHLDEKNCNAIQLLSAFSCFQIYGGYLSEIIHSETIWRL